MKKKIHEPLQRILSEFDPVLWEFVHKLTLDEQKNLYNLLQKLLEEEGGTLFSTLAMISRIIPAFLSAKIAQEMMGPQMAARMTTYIPIKKAIGIAKIMKTENPG